MEIHTLECAVEQNAKRIIAHDVDVVVSYQRANVAAS